MNEALMKALLRRDQRLITGGPGRGASAEIHNICGLPQPKIQIV
jgi:hypothetical protein